MKKIVIAIGGNALGDSPEEQLEITRNTAKHIADLVEDGNQVVIVHGNGPQVGMINRKLNVPEITNENMTMPFPECGAMSQGYIGYHLQNAVTNELRLRSINKPVATIVTQALVDSNDSAFLHPTKPIGAFYTKEQARDLEQKKGYTMILDAGRGYRQVVPSPKPIDIIEKECILKLMDMDFIVIAAGGGGIPVVLEEGRFVGIDAVIDKDLAAEQLAEQLDADLLVILTAVERIAINYGQPSQIFLSKVNIRQAKEYCEQGHFAPGSMLPKVEAAIAFTESGKKRKAIIGSLEQAALAVKGKSGTIFTE